VRVLKRNFGYFGTLEGFNMDISSKNNRYGWSLGEIMAWENVKFQALEGLFVNLNTSRVLYN